MTILELLGCVQLLKEKSDFLSGIKGFISMAKTQFDKQVKVIGFDNENEFDDQYYRPFYDDLGIIHQTSSCVNTPQ